MFSDPIGWQNLTRLALALRVGLGWFCGPYAMHNFQRRKRREEMSSLALQAPGFYELTTSMTMHETLSREPESSANCTSPSAHVWASATSLM